MLRSLFICIFAAGLIWSAPAQAGVVGKALGARGMSDEVQNLGDAIQAEATALAGTLGRGKVDTVRGASGALGELALNSGDLICNAWILSFRLKILDMIMENGRLSGELQTRHLELLHKMEEFAGKLEKECARVGFMGPQGPSGALNEDGEVYEPQPEPVDDGRVRPREGETIADEICRRKCINEYVKMETEERILARSEQSLAWANEQVRARQAEYDDKRSRLADAQKTLAQTDKIIRKTTSGSLSGQRGYELQEAGRANADAQREIERLTPEVEQARIALEKAQNFARNVERHLQDDRRRAEAARRAYYQCLKSCLKAAQQAGEATTLTCPEQYTCPAPAQGSNKTEDKRSEETAPPVKKQRTAASCPKPPQKLITVGPNGKYGTGAQRKEKIKDTATGMAMGALGGALGGKGVGLGGGGDSFGSDVFGGGGGGKSSGGPKTKKDPVKSSFVRIADQGGTDLGLRAGTSGGNLILSAKVFDSPGDGTFHTMWLTDAAGNVHLPNEYLIFSLYQDWQLTVWWTQDRWVNGEHVYHDEGREVTTGRNDLGNIAAWYEGEKGVESSIWANMGFKTATKGIQSIGASFPLANIATDGACPVTATVYVTEPDKDPVTALPFTYELTPGETGWNVAPFGG